MVSGGPLLVAAVLGTATGAFLESYWLHGSPLSLVVAFSALAAAVVVPLGLSKTIDRRRARDASARLRERNRSRYDAHAEELNESGFRPLREIRLETSAPDPHGASPGSLSLGVPDGPRVRPLESLPHWNSVVQHLTSEPALTDAWSRASETAASYRRLKLALVRELKKEFEHRVLREYGFDVRLDGFPSEATTWCDVEALAWLAASRSDGLDPRELTVVTPLEGPTDAPPEELRPHIIAVSGARLFVSPLANEADPLRLYSVIAEVTRAERHVRRTQALRVAEEAAQQECRRFAEGVRAFSDRVLLERTFSGTCDGCRAWTPR